MKTNIINLGLSIIILLAASGQFLNAMEHEGKPAVENSTVDSTDYAEPSSICESRGEQRNHSNFSIEDEKVLPDLLTWTIQDMCENGNSDLNELDQLLESGNYDICQGFSLALNYRNIKIAQFLAEKGAIKILESKGTPNISRIKSFLYPEKQKPNTKNSLALAVILKDVKSVKQLLQEGQPADAVDNDGLAPLHWVACGGHKKIVKLLICSGANVDIKDKKGFTPLILAAQMGHTKVAELLLSHGAKIHKKGPNGFTALQWAKSHEQEEMEKLLRSWGANDDDLICVAHGPFDVEPNSDSK